MKRLWELFGPFLALLVVVAPFAVLEPNFLSVANLRTVSAQTVGVALGALGMTFVIVSGGIDLSVGSVVALGAVVTALSSAEGWPPILALAAGMGAGALCGMVNGLLITRLRIVPFIVTLGMFGAARGAAKWIAGNQGINADPGWLQNAVAAVSDYLWLGLAPSVWTMLFLGLILALVLRRTVFGTHTYSVGSNEANARLCGVRVERTKVWIYTLCGLLAGLAGVVHFSRLTVGEPTAAMGYELRVIAAVVIGGGSLAGGEGTILGSLVGAFTMAFLENGCTLMGIPNYSQDILIGVIIVVAVAIDAWRRR